MSTVTVVATVEASNHPPRVRLDVTDTGSSPAHFSTTVTRLDPDGRTVTVRTSDGNPLVLTTSGSSRVGLFYDYEMPYGALVSYSTVESPSVRSVEVSVPETRVWLIHPGVPELSCPVTVASIGDRTRIVQRGVHRPMGRAAPVVQTDGARKSAEYVLSVLTFTDSERADLDDLFSDAGALLLNKPASKTWGAPSEYVSVGDVVEARVARYAGEAMRTWGLPLTVIDRPEGGSQAERTYLDVLADHPTYASLLTAYATYLDLLAGP